MIHPNEIKPLTPLSGGVVLIVGVKSSNLDDEIKTHPRVVIWDSQQEHWTNKDMPANTRAVFMTRFISHSAHGKIVAEARKRNINIFNPEGTGLIARQVKELLHIQPETKPETEAKEMKQHGKLTPLIPHIDFSMGNTDNARHLMVMAKELGIETTEGSLTQFVVVQRRKQNQTAVPKSLQSKLDVSVQMLDNAIKDMTDMRAFLIATVEENKQLKAKLDGFKKLLGE